MTALAAQAFTLAWTHSIEKIRWEEDWQVEGSALHLVEARIRGSGAGMEPPAGSRLKQGVWHYDPHLPPLAELRLTLSPYTSGYTLCTGGVCMPLIERLPASARPETGVVTVTACGG